MGPIGYTILGAVFATLVISLSFATLLLRQRGDFRLASFKYEGYHAEALDSGATTMIIAAEEPVTVHIVREERTKDPSFDGFLWTTIADATYGPQRTHFLRVTPGSSETLCVVQSLNKKPCWVFTAAWLDPADDATNDALREQQRKDQPS